MAERAEANFRGRSNYLEATMTIVSPRLATPRAVRFRSWDDPDGKRSFVHILGPPKDAGTRFLMIHPNLWMYVPRVERTVRIPPSMMLQSWMGSDFSNDDLVRSSSQLDDYDHRLLGIAPAAEATAGRRAYVVEYLPHEDAPVVWGRIVVWVDVDWAAIHRSEYYDEEGELLRIMRMGDFREVQGRRFPHSWSMVPLEKQGHETSIAIEVIRFDEEFDDGVFSKRNLRRRE